MKFAATGAPPPWVPHVLLTPPATRKPFCDLIMAHLNARVLSYSISFLRVPRNGTGQQDATCKAACAYPPILLKQVYAFVPGVLACNQIAVSSCALERYMTCHQSVPSKEESGFLSVSCV